MKGIRKGKVIYGTYIRYLGGRGEKKKKKVKERNDQWSGLQRLRTPGTSAAGVVHGATETHLQPAQRRRFH